MSNSYNPFQSAEEGMHMKEKIVGIPQRQERPSCEDLGDVEPQGEAPAPLHGVYGAAVRDVLAAAREMQSACRPPSSPMATIGGNVDLFCCLQQAIQLWELVHRPCLVSPAMTENSGVD